MKYFKIPTIIFFSILLLTSCGYKNLNSEKLNNFKIGKLEIKGEVKLAYKIKNNIEIYSNQNSTTVYDLEINLMNEKESKIKNTAGKTIRYSTKLEANILISNTNYKKEIRRTFSYRSDYDVGSTHSDTLNNEKKAIENNINYISNEIIKYLKLLNI